MMRPTAAASGFSTALAFARVLRRTILVAALALPGWTMERTAAQNQQPASARPPARTLDGKPDLSGFWRGPLLRNMDKNVPGGFKAIFTPAGAAAYERNRTKTINPEGLCLFAGIPRASISGVPFEIVQSPTRVAFLYELMWTFRSIPVDGRRLPAAPEPSFFGTAVGRWDGFVDRRQPQEPSENFQINPWYPTYERNFR